MHPARSVRPASTILATDFGQPHNLPPVEGMAAYVAGLLDNGFSKDEVRGMATDHARALLQVRLTGYPLRCARARWFPGERKRRVAVTRQQRPGIKRARYRAWAGR
ncbi:MAG TPA: hypothetical protein VKV73_32720 [Chloroflexota bacterium]|nr:hypothetical protein [Chloroflexota bacterium]